MDAVIAKAFIEKLGDIEKIERLVAIAEGRRDSILREIYRRRATFGQALCDAVQKVEDAEFETVQPKAIAPKATRKNAA